MASGWDGAETVGAGASVRRDRRGVAEGDCGSPAAPKANFRPCGAFFPFADFIVQKICWFFTPSTTSAALLLFKIKHNIQIMFTSYTIAA